MEKIKRIYFSWIRGWTNGDAPKNENSAEHQAKVLISAIKEDDAEHLRDVLEKENLDVNAKLKNGITPLIFACINKKYQSAEVLLDHGADPNIEDNEGYNALFHLISSAAYEQDYRMIMILIKKGADVNYKNKYGISVMIHAIFSQNLEAVRILAVSGADLNAKFNDKTYIEIISEMFGKEKAEYILNFVKAKKPQND